MHLKKSVNFFSFGGTPSLKDLGFRGRSSTSGLVDLKPKLGVLHPSMFGPKLGQDFDMLWIKMIEDV